MLRHPALVLLMLAVLACGRAPLRVAVIGDFGADTPEEAEVAALVRGSHPDLVVTVGDNNYPRGAAETIDRNIGKYYAEFIAPYRGAFGKGGATNRFFPALGNHDWGTEGAKPYLDYFELPGNERYYDVARGGVHLFILDSDPREPDGITRDSAQAGWLRDALARAPEPHKWVLFHHPPYSSGAHGSNPELQWPFRAWGASAVFCGHDHVYERLEIDGMPYVTVGASGKSFYEFRDPVPGSVVRIAGRAGALRIEVTGAGASGEFVSASEGTLDRFALPPSAALPAAVSLLGSGSSWRILDGQTPGERWQAPNFDTSAWAAAAAPLRIFDRGASAPPRTTYYRSEFEVVRPEEIAALELGLPRDQAAIAYLNGREVARVERNPEREARWLVPRGPRPGSAAPILVHRPLDPGALVSGTNVLALEVRRVPEEGGDPGFDAELLAFPRPGL